MWRALANAETFGEWFGANLKGQSFAPGQRARGQLTFKGYEHVWFDIVVERIEPQKVLSYRWHPYAVEPAVDYTKEEPTLVTFTLSDLPGNGTLLAVVESGFDKVPPHRRLEAFRMNTRGWEEQGRERLWQLEPVQIEEARRTLDVIGKQWEVALGRLKAFVESR